MVTKLYDNLPIYKNVIFLVHSGKEADGRARNKISSHLTPDNKNSQQIARQSGRLLFSHLVLDGIVGQMDMTDISIVLFFESEKI